MQYSTCIIILLILAFAPVRSLAQAYDINGFVSQGVIQSEDSNFINEEGDVSFKLTEVGLNGFYRFNSNLRVASQVVYINGDKRYTEGGRIDYLFLDWRLPSIIDWQLNLHLGRVKNYHWLYSATRDVPHTRPSIVLPQSVYFDAFRDIALGSDGVSFLASNINDWGDWNFYWSYGNSEITRAQMRNLLSPLAMGKIKQDFVHQFNFTWQPNSSRIQLGFNLLDSDFAYKAAAQDAFINGEATVQRAMLLFHYFRENIEVSAELMRERVIFSDLLFPGFASDQTGEGGYFQAKYHLDDNLSLLARLDIYDRDRKDRDGRQFSANSPGQIPAYFAFADQATLGITWRPFPTWQIQAEVHRAKGAAKLAPVLNPNVQVNEEYWNIWALQLSHWF